MTTSDEVSIALHVCLEALRRYGEDNIALSFNGGKDCTVLLELYALALEQFHAEQVNGSQSSNEHLLAAEETGAPTADATARHIAHRYEGRPIRTVYVFQPDPFHEVEQFIAESVERYNLELTRIDEARIKEGLTMYLADHKNVAAILVGTRRTDPHAGTLQHFSPTDNGWPVFIRVNPIIDWSYASVWMFLRERGVPYCELYDKGYTSLGSRFNTVPNPYLERPDHTFAPAYELKDESHERAGRYRSK